MAKPNFYLCWTLFKNTNFKYIFFCLRSCSFIIKNLGMNVLSFLFLSETGLHVAQIDLELAI